jgi:nucleoside-diphosphate-sugar epimerase
MISSASMARKAFLLGGSGQVGRAVLPRLLERDWEVVVGSRGETAVPEGVSHVRVERGDGDALRAAVQGGFDVLVDFVAYEAEHADQLLALKDLVRSVIVLSSGAVYVDAEGRGFEPPELPRLPVPVTEHQQTATGKPTTYATKKAEIERRLLGQRDLPATVLRAGTIYGPETVFSREWYFVKRALDRRPVIVLADRGRSRFHPVSVHTLAELIWLAAERPGRRVVNAADPDAPTALEISRTIAAVLDYDWAELLVEGTPGVGETPWSVPHPFVMDMTEAEFELGYRPITNYAKAVPETVEWLVEATKNRDWREVLPRSAEIMKGDFDYEAEDAFLRGLV